MACTFCRGLNHVTDSPMYDEGDSRSKIEDNKLKIEYVSSVDPSYYNSSRSFERIIIPMNFCLICGEDLLNMKEEETC